MNQAINLGKKNSYNLGKRNGMKDDDIGMTAAADGYTEIDPSQQHLYFHYWLGERCCRCDEI